MSNPVITSCRERLAIIKNACAELQQIGKSAFLAAPPMPQGPPGAAMGGAPPMDPAMMQGGGMPPMDPAMMQGGMPPMDPAMMQGGGAPSMDPAMMQAGAPPPPISPDTVDQIVSLLEDMGQQLASSQQNFDKFQQEISSAVEDLGTQVMDLEKRLAGVAATMSATPAAPSPAEGIATQQPAGPSVW